jgi:AcrR family transcriptional regulator
MDVTDVAAAAVRGRPRSNEADLAITRATIELLFEEGYEGLTMAGVAQRAGVSTATLYRRYQSKEDLVVGAVAGMKDEFDQTETGRLVDDIRAMATEGCATFHSAGGQLMKSMIGEVQRNPELAAAVRRQVIDHRREKARRIIEAAVERGEIPPPADADVALDMIGGPMVFRALVTGEPLDEEFAENLTRLALRMLGAADPDAPADTAETAGTAEPAGRRRR